MTPHSLIAPMCLDPGIDEKGCASATYVRDAFLSLAFFSLSLVNIFVSEKKFAKKIKSTVVAITSFGNWRSYIKRKILAASR